MCNSNHDSESPGHVYDSYDWASEDLDPMDLRDEPEFARYFERWIKYLPRKPYNVKRGYDGGFVQVKTGKGNPAALHGDWLISCVERHLSGWRWAEQNVEKKKAKALAALVAQGWSEASAAKWIAHQTWAGYYPVVERPYWLGLWPARKITDHCIDFDAKEYMLARYRHRGLVEPVVCPDVGHFQKLKRIYDDSPNRVWCISSLTLGVHAWAKHDLWERRAVHRRVKENLARIGLGAVEVHPMQGRCLRRPFGRDYSTLTPEGELTAWQDQVAYYEDDGRTAPFDLLVEAMIRRVERAVAAYYKADERLQDWRALAPVGSRLDAVRSWRDAGFRERAVVSFGDSTPSDPVGITGGCDTTRPSASDFLGSPECGPADDDGRIGDGSGTWATEIGTSSSRTGRFVPDLRCGEWPLWIEAMARDGLAADDTVGEVVFEMAKWLFWVELYGLPTEERKGRVRSLLERYVEARHNGHVTRILNGRTDLVLAQVKSAVDSAARIRRAESLELFAKLRQRRGRGAYHRLIMVEPILAGEDAAPSFSSSPSSTTLLFSNKDVPLPAELEADLARIARDERMRKRGGEYPLVRFARRFLRILWDRQGSARLGTGALMQLSGVNSPKVQNDYKRLLRDAGLVDDWENDYLRASSTILDAPSDRPPVARPISDGYKIGAAPLLYRLGERAEEAFRRDCHASRRADSG